MRNAYRTSRILASRRDSRASTAPPTRLPPSPDLGCIIASKRAANGLQRRRAKRGSQNAKSDVFRHRSTFPYMLTRSVPILSTPSTRGLPTPPQWSHPRSHEPSRRSRPSVPRLLAPPWGGRSASAVPLLRRHRPLIARGARCALRSVRPMARRAQVSGKCIIHRSQGPSCPSRKRQNGGPSSLMHHTRPSICISAMVKRAPRKSKTDA